MQAALVGLAVGAAGLFGVFSAFTPLSRHGAERTVGAGGGVTEGVPAGKLLVGLGNGAATFTIGSQAPQELAIGTQAPQGLDTTVAPFEFSPDGRGVLAGILKHEPSGLGYIEQVFMVDLQTAVPSLLLQVDSPASIAAARLSPDGSTLACTYAPDRFKNASLLAQDKVPEYLLCLMDLATSEKRCFPEIGTLFSFDWSPDGRTLLLGKPGGEPMQTLDVATGTVSTLVAPDDPAVLAALEQAGFTDVTSTQFIEPSWSPSGKYVGTLAGTVPMIFSSGGQLVATGRPTLEPNGSSWSPTDDVFAYAAGSDGHPAPGTPAAYVLDPATGEDRLVLLTEGTPDPDIDDVVWSPGGRWLALGNTLLIRIVDTTGVLPAQEIDPYADSGGGLLAWET